jgi:hypothetical protein
MSYQNIRQFTPNNNFPMLSLETYDMSITSDEQNYNQEVVFSPYLIAQTYGNRLPFYFDINSSASTQSLILTYKNYNFNNIFVSENYYNPNNENLSCQLSGTSCDIGLTGIDNGLVTGMTGETIVFTDGLLPDNLKFNDTYSVNQGFSLINYILENPNVNTNTLSPLTDDVAPVVYFYNQVVGTSSYIEFNGATAGPYNTSLGNTFSTSMSLVTFGTISNNLLVDVLVGSVSDARDGLFSITGSNLIITKDSTTYTSITASGTYSIEFTNIKDLAENSISGVKLTLTITA